MTTLDTSYYKRWVGKDRGLVAMAVVRNLLDLFKIKLTFFVGRVDPIRIDFKEDVMGLGKREEDDFYATNSATKRKAMDIEKEDTEELKKRKEVR